MCLRVEGFPCHPPSFIDKIVSRLLMVSLLRRVSHAMKRCILGKNEVKIAGYWPSSVFFCFCVFMNEDVAKKRTRPISSHLNRTSLVNKGFIIWDKTLKHDNFFLRDKARIPSGQDGAMVPVRVANHSARFG